MWKSYSDISDKLRNSTLSKKELENSKIYKSLMTHNDKLKVFFANFTSFCNQKTPSKIRLRNDKFLESSVNKEESYLLSGIKLDNKQIIICISSESFFDYSFSTKNSNSFITLDYDDLKKLVYFDQDTIQYWTYGKNVKYSFFVSYNENFNENLFWNEFIHNVFYIRCKDIDINKIIIPQIPESIREKIVIKFHDRCALDQESIFKCPCGNNIDINFLKQNNLSYIHLHHFVPKELFKEMYYNGKIDNLDPYLIHNPVNLVPLCMPCHQSIHKKSNRNLVTNTYNYILETFKNMNLKNDFLDFLKKCNITEEFLLNFYLGI